MTYELKLCEPGRRDWFNLFIFSEDAKGIQVLGAAHLELDNILTPLDLHRMGNLPPRSQKKVLNLADLHRLQSNLFHKTIRKKHRHKMTMRY